MKFFIIIKEKSERLADKNFLELGDKINFGKSVGQTGTFGMLFGRLSAISDRKSKFEISKTQEILPFFGIFFNFFFQNLKLV